MDREGFVNVEGGRIWYQIVGDNHQATPLLTLHGGPGSAHLGMEPLAKALGSKRPVVLYDQLGCGQSDRPEDNSLWTVERFVRELATLRDALGLKQVHILGHSWGTMLLADYLLTQPAGVASAVFSSPCLSVPRWIEDADRNRKELPEDVQVVLRECEANGTTDSEAYRNAEKVYMQKYLCRVERSEDEKARRKAAFGESVYEYMWGPSEFHATGTLRNYDQTGRLPEIAVPCLFTCGFYDEASPASTGYYHSLIAGSEFHVYPNSSHSPMVEEPEAYFRTVDAFLCKHE
ncbi:proline iminopeptidase-family hydrolase [Alicyclobacillus sp. ALC3]|uniref:proline iminopeptidase-family hydrolase n=1 Tax=Alicyclobacillus sp. ALC3 TaxID=2796143 RepID=UPI0023784B48|nr:proline iminopeptidase-family hydrolase [Alicyclobacillus sp. ALC3]WDL95748.1 proline iminopeptidase-family hydrolase [Alicyclobacillus sp. ALC3]